MELVNLKTLLMQYKQKRKNNKPGKLDSRFNQQYTPKS